MLRSAGDVAAAVDAPSLVLSAADQATAHSAAAPRGRLEQYLLDLGVRDAGLLRQSAELDERAQQVLAQAHRAEPIHSQPDAQVTPGPDAAGVAAEVTWAAQAAANEPEAEGGLEIEPG
jgi:hypothetical protein